MPAKSVGLGDLVHPEALIGALNYLKDVSFTSLTLTSTNIWRKRTNLIHRQKAEKAKTSGDKERPKVDYGLRYPSLLQLPYYDAIRMSSIIKTQLKVYGWEKELLVIKYLSLYRLEWQILYVVENTGRIPSNIASNFGGFTGNQWINWTKLGNSKYASSCTYLRMH